VCIHAYSGSSVGTLLYICANSSTYYEDTLHCSLELRIFNYAILSRYTKAAYSLILNYLQPLYHVLKLYTTENPDPANSVHQN
jgi:hypothetical protein